MSPRYGMVVDLNRCVGCQTCTAACKHANDTLPGVQWRQVLDVEMGRYPDVERLFLVVGCQHCAEPPCVPVCPSGATYQREDGLVAMDYDLCLGCGYCAVACPYQARSIVHDGAWYFDAPTLQERAVAHPERLGVAQKCTFCVEKIDEARSARLDPGCDPAVTPACAASCIAQAIRFGDFNDTDSAVAKLVAAVPSFQMHAELGTDPQIRYLYEHPAVPGRAITADDDTAPCAADGSSVLGGTPQRWWDTRAAANFTLGGAGAGLAVMAYLSHLVGAVPSPTLPGLFVSSAALTAAGLLAVFLEIGRKARFAYVVRRPQTSWMTREVYAVALFYALVLGVVVVPSPLAHAGAALAALAFLYCQARLLHAAKGIPAWRVPLMPWMLLASGMLEGVGLLALTAGLLLPSAALTAPIAVAGIVLAGVNAALWHRYRRGAAGNGVGRPARAVIDDVTPWLHGVGHLLPTALLGAALPLESPRALYVFAGAAAIVGGALWKSAVITRACHQQGFALPNGPRRGSGRYAAPQRRGAGDTVR